MTRTEIQKAVDNYLQKGGKIIKLPDGPNFRFEPHDVKAAPSDPIVDVTITETPTTQQQMDYMEDNSL